MAERPLHILQVNTTDLRGGAAGIAWELFQAYRARGHGSWLAVGQKLSDDPDVLLTPNDQYRSGWTRCCFAVGNMLSPLIGRVRGVGRLRRWLHWWIGQPRRTLEIQCGHEDFDFPGTWRLLALPPGRPDIVHCHNLHGKYFDLRVLPWLSEQIPVVLTLHDAWLLSCHCAYPFACKRWKRGCGQCPDWTLPPAVRRDATAYNWRQKQAIYTQSQLYVATPSDWLMQKVEQSILAPAIVESRVIHNGVNLNVFHPANRQHVRANLGIPKDANVLLFTANRIRKNSSKDYQTMRAAVALTAERLHDRAVLFIALGEDAPAESIGQAEVRFVPYQEDPQIVACYYQAADVYIHAARADNFPTTVLEALACGKPVVATAVGGIPEQVKGLRMTGDGLNEHSADEATGILVAPGDAEGMAEGIITLMIDEELYTRLGENATQDARRRFDLNRQAEDYLEWYQEIIERWSAERLALHGSNLQ